MTQKEHERTRNKLPERKKKLMHLENNNKKTIRNREKKIMKEKDISPSHPGVSGKDEDGMWINEPIYELQREIIGEKSKDYDSRSDNRIFEEASEALRNNSNINYEYIGIYVDHGVIHLQGKVESKHEKRNAEICVRNLPGVKEVSNELRVEKNVKGPEVATKKDLGIENFNDYQ